MNSSMKFRRLRVLYALGVMKKTRCARSARTPQGARARRHGVSRAAAVVPGAAVLRAATVVAGRGRRPGAAPEQLAARQPSVCRGSRGPRKRAKATIELAAEPAAHTKRSMSRAARAEEKIRLLDGIGGYTPHGSLPSRRDGGSSSSSGGWGFSKYAPSAGQAVLACAFVAMVGAAVVFPEVVTVGRYALTGTIARAVARAPQDQRGGRRTGSVVVVVAAVASIGRLPPDPDADAPCARLVAGDADVSSELLSLVHAAKRHRESGTRVVWDYADAAATCPCGELVRFGERRVRETSARGSSFCPRGGCCASPPSSAGACAPAGPRARPTTGGPRCSPATRAFTDASAEGRRFFVPRGAPVGEENGFGLKRGRRRVAGGGRAQRHVRGGAGRVGVEPGDARGSGRRDEEPGR